METTIDSNGLGGFQTRQDRILCIRSQINRSSEELARINEKLGAKDTPPWKSGCVFRIFVIT